MATERFTVTALPYSCAPNADFHVTLFVSPVLTPDGDETPLGEFALFPHWASTLTEDARFELFDDRGPIDAEPLLGQVNSSVWDAAFPEDTPVRGRNELEWENRHWRTFRANEVHDAAKLSHQLSMFASPTSPPPASQHPYIRLFAQLGGGFERSRGRYDESAITRMLDDEMGEAAPLTEPGRPLAEIERIIDGSDNPMLRLLMELHRTRRFYERPESQEEYLERPVDGAQQPRPPRPGPDFHERCALAGDHRVLLRRLGLAIDLRVMDPDRLRSSTWLSARIVARGDEAAGQTTRTRCQVVGDDLVTVAETADWQQERLRLGDQERYDVLDLEADGSALKLERFLWTLPRLLQVEQNGDPAHAAPPALRSTGFTVVRKRRGLESIDRLARQRQLQQVIDHGEPPLLSTEDVTQGMRVEVWDDTEQRWLSLHARRVDMEVLGHGQVLTDEPEQGFVQGTTASETAGVDNSPIHIHDAMFGWEGWSLSAPKPGMRVRHEGGDEIVEDPDADPDPVTPIVITTRVDPGTLPRLRYGRLYAFRVWAVDLACNVRPHDLGGAEDPDPGLPAAIGAVLDNRPWTLAAAPLVAPLRAETIARVDEALTALPVPAPADPQSSPLLLHPDVDRAVRSRLLTRRGALSRPAPTATDVSWNRAGAVTQAFASALRAANEPVVVDTSVRDPGRLAAILAADIHRITPEQAAEAVLALSPLRPYLRWDPVLPPAIVPRWRYTAGESLRQIVVRSGVTQDLATLAVTVTGPADYAAAQAALGYHATSERHLAPPKTSQVQAEQHGRFDDAIGSADPARHRRLLATALRESGTFFDLDVVRLDDPTQRDPQPGVALEHEPSAPESTLKTLPLPLGDGPAPGQYVVHDTDQLALPYLPDPAAAGISLVFPDAGLDRAIPFPFGTEGFTVAYPGDWPAAQPFRLVLEGSDRLTGRLDGTVLRLGLPAADVQRFRLASSLHPDELMLFGPWHSLPASVAGNADVAEAAADGWLWGLTPFEDVTLVHAVPRPLEAPRPTLLRSIRTQGSTDSVLLGAVDVHGPSTDSLTAEATWVEPVDDLTLPVPEDRPHRSVAFTVPIIADEDLALLGATNFQFVVSGHGSVRMHANVHHFGDTKHRTVRYRFRATTRFREYFDPSELTPPPPPDPDDLDAVTDDGRSVVGPVTTVSVPSTARPAAPIVHSVLPLFRWDESTEPEQPVAVRRTRRAGMRIYLERPWYSSGEGELLAVLVAPSAVDDGIEPWVSQWGADPIWEAAPVQRRAMFLELEDLLRASGLDDTPGDALPVVPPTSLPLTSLPSHPEVIALGYRPQYNPERGLWYVDVAVDPGSTFWPFVRLAVARYQPDSIDGCHLSAPVRCDFVQLTPERTMSVSRTDVRHVRVVVSGPVGLRARDLANPVERFVPYDFATLVRGHHTMVARLQRRDPAIPTDLGWQTVAATELVVRGRGRNQYEAAWVGSLEAPEDIALVRPGHSADWRVQVEEWERLPGDPASLAPAASTRPVWERRLIYADETEL